MDKIQLIEKISSGVKGYPNSSLSSKPKNLRIQDSTCLFYLANLLSANGLNWQAYNASKDMHTTSAIGNKIEIKIKPHEEDLLSNSLNVVQYLLLDKVFPRLEEKIIQSLDYESLSINLESLSDFMFRSISGEEETDEDKIKAQHARNTKALMKCIINLHSIEINAHYIDDYELPIEISVLVTCHISDPQNILKKAEVNDTKKQQLKEDVNF